MMSMYVGGCSSAVGRSVLAPAVVWHHRRNSVRAYWKQQQGYGKAEAMLERKWPEKYNAAGHATWHGRIYGNGHKFISWRTGRIYHGMWGTAPYQPLHEPMPNLIESLPLMPEWYLVIAALAGLSCLGLLRPHLGWALVGLVIAVGLSVLQACRCAAGITFDSHQTRAVRLQQRLLTAWLHIVQPVARLFGRIRHGLTFWRRRPAADYTFPKKWTADIWTARTEPAETRLQSIEIEARRC